MVGLRIKLDITKDLPCLQERYQHGKKEAGRKRKYIGDSGSHFLMGVGGSDRYSLLVQRGAPSSGGGLDLNRRWEGSEGRFLKAGPL